MSRELIKSHLNTLLQSTQRDIASLKSLIDPDSKNLNDLFSALDNMNRFDDASIPEKQAALGKNWNSTMILAEFKNHWTTN